LFRSCVRPQHWLPAPCGSKPASSDRAGGLGHLVARAPAPAAWLDVLPGSTRPCGLFALNVRGRDVAPISRLSGVRTTFAPSAASESRTCGTSDTNFGSLKRTCNFDISMGSHKAKGDVMSFPGFTANASLPANAPRRRAYRGKFRHEASSRGIEPALPGAAEQAYIDCVIDCRVAARRHEISDLAKCIRGCAGDSGTSSGSGTSGGLGTSGGSSPPPALCPSGSVLVTCPDGFIGCCPSPFGICTILPFVGRWCV
jgi:hypothetical protein